MKRFNKFNDEASYSSFIKYEAEAGHYTSYVLDFQPVGDVTDIPIGKKIYIKDDVCYDAYIDDYDTTGEYIGKADGKMWILCDDEEFDGKDVYYSTLENNTMNNGSSYMDWTATGFSALQYEHGYTGGTTWSTYNATYRWINKGEAWSDYLTYTDPNNDPYGYDYGGYYKIGREITYEDGKYVWKWYGYNKVSSDTYQGESWGYYRAAKNYVSPNLGYDREWVPAYMFYKYNGKRLVPPASLVSEDVHGYGDSTYTNKRKVKSAYAVDSVKGFVDKSSCHYDYVEPLLHIYTDNTVAISDVGINYRVEFIPDSNNMVYAYFDMRNMKCTTGYGYGRWMMFPTSKTNPTNRIQIFRDPEYKNVISETLSYASNAWISVGNYEGSYTSSTSHNLYNVVQPRVSYLDGSSIGYTYTDLKPEYYDLYLKHYNNFDVPTTFFIPKKMIDSWELVKNPSYNGYGYEYNTGYMYTTELYSVKKISVN